MKKNGLLYIIFFFLVSSGLFAQTSELHNDSLDLSLNNRDTLTTIVKSSSSSPVKVKSSYQLFLYGVKNFQEQDYVDATGFFNNSMNGIDDKRIYLYRGRAFLNSGKYENAINDFMHYNKSNPNGASWDLARTYAAMNNAGIAIEHLKNNLKSPYRQRWSVILKDSLMMKMQGNPTWVSFTDKQIVPDAEKLAIEAEDKIEDQLYREALNAANAAIQHEPRNPDWYGLRAKINVESGKFDEAVKDYKKELSLAPHRTNEVYKNIAYLYVRKGDLKTASVLLNEIVKRDPLEFLLMLDIAEIEMERHNTHGALKVIDRYIKVMPEDDEAFFLRANILEGEQAKADVNRAILLCKDNKKPVPQKYNQLLKTFN